ncbi:kinesin-like protein KIF2A isoform X2 [Panonychus citri]|uniref:kinesin-like protein KIF2A isoform X2 n=1 Tax=Panonychus citri TaxID=50023 RepID=UPI00230825E1|nr:kinesin-like protein KIF2A isoform X2 [Panonychus citri]
MEKLRIGLDVDIQRTNGRIHSAVISNVDYVNRSVTVEWSESEEIKGKEIDFESVYLLNPNLCDESSNQSKTVAPRRVGILFPSTLNKVLPPRPSVAALNSTKGSLRMRQQQSRQTISNGNGMSIPEALPTVLTSAPCGLINQSTLNQTIAQKSAIGIPVGAKDAQSRRRSNVVKEVDRIKKQREERRNRQAEQKQEKQDLMSAVDQGNPNWEFLGMIREYRSQIEYKPLSMGDPVAYQQICVAVRKRPMNKKEVGKKDIDVITVPSKDLIVVHEPKHKVDLTRYLENHMFRFDYAFDETADNELIYRYTAKPLVQTIFEGGMATCFAYGQTGSGKTHTMGGDFNGKSQDSSRGIYYLAARDVFKLVKSPKYRNEDFVVYASFFEIYSGKVFDLLNNKAKLRVLEDAKNQVQVVGLQERSVETVDDVLKLIQMGNNIRTSGVTSANNHSSRSHAVFQIILKRKNNNRLRGKFSLIDLAGNERGADTSSANRQTRMEGAEINKSLLALKECIRALGRKGAHLPFRASKLTQVLRDSFIGENSRTCMISMISPGMQSCEHSLNTLRYADRVKELGADNPGPRNIEYEDDDMLTKNGDDLALLHNSNADDLPDDLYNFHETLSHLQEMEDEILDIHKTFVETLPQWTSSHAQLLKMTAEVDYDVDSYVAQLEDSLEDHIEVLTRFKERVGNFRGQLAEEELMSKRIIK